MKPYPDLNAGSSGSTEPVTVGAEAKGVDHITAVQGVEVLAFIQVPQHGLAILMWKTEDILQFKHLLKHLKQTVTFKNLQH